VQPSFFFKHRSLVLLLKQLVGHILPTVTDRHLERALQAAVFILPDGAFIWFPTVSCLQTAAVHCSQPTVANRWQFPEFGVTLGCSTPQAWKAALLMHDM
jgi:hypothetical protein